MIYTDIAKTLANSRSHASSITQLMMVDRVTYLLAQTLSEYQRFNTDAFLTKAKYGYDVPIDKTLEV
jgi:hypothetical protein